MTQQTLLVVTPQSGFSGFQLQPFSGRQLKQSLDEIDPVGGEGLFERDGNGGIINYTRPQFQKLKSTITFSDLRAPVFNSSWRGAMVTVDCAAKRWLQASDTPDRPLVPGTSVITQGSYKYFYPELIMTVINATLRFEEWKGVYSGQMVLWEN